MYRAKDKPVSEWLNKMGDLAEKVNDLYGVHLVWQRGRNKHMLMEELLCPVINTITTEVKVCVIDFYKRQAESDTDYGSDDERVECCRVDGRTIPRVWTQPRVRNQRTNGDNIMRLLMWNPENLAQSSSPHVSPPTPRAPPEQLQRAGSLIMNGRTHSEN